MNVAEIGARVRALRIRQGLTLAGLAEKAGAHENTVRRVERGRGSATVGTLALLAEALGVPLAHLVRESRAKSHPTNTEA